jgi:APA family basic amino acid/polyamine antiporter
VGLEYLEQSAQRPPKAGSGILLAMVLGGHVALFTGISAAQLGVNDPKEGGAFTWAGKLNHKTLGFIAGCAYLGKGIFSQRNLARFCRIHGALFPGLPTALLAASAILGIMLLNFIHVGLPTKVLIALMLVNVSLLRLFVVFTVASVNPAHFGFHSPAAVIMPELVLILSKQRILRD